MLDLVKNIQLNKLINKKVLLRVDFNCPIIDGKIMDTSRIDLVFDGLKSISEICSNLIILTHVGRPKGIAVEKLSLLPVKLYIEKKLEKEILFFTSIFKLKNYLEKNKSSGNIFLLENLRFDSREEENDINFAKELADLGEIYVNDAFSCSHRKHASVATIPTLMESYAGFHMIKELDALNKFFDTPKGPMTAIVGGSKISTKIGILKKLLLKVDHLILGGGMANTFLTAKGINIGKSLYEKKNIDDANEIFQIAKIHNCTIHLPIDCIVSSEFIENAVTSYSLINDLPKNKMILDIGKKSVTNFKKIIDKSKTVFWNGPLGAFEIKPFEMGTFELAKYVAAKTEKKLVSSIAGGGDTISVLNKVGVTKSFNYVSLAGGAFLEFLEGKNLPGIKALEINKN